MRSGAPPSNGLRPGSLPEVVVVILGPHINSSSVASIQEARTSVGDAACRREEDYILKVLSQYDAIAL
jgi:hypothetical protein